MDFDLLDLKECTDMQLKNNKFQQRDKECESKFCQKRINIEMNKEEERKEILKMLKRL